jgi:hypothetical protein
MNRTEIKKANEIAVKRMTESDPYLVAVKPAGEVIPGLSAKTVLHAGPPVTWERMCGPVKGAVAGALMLEGLAGSIEDAYQVAASGSVTFKPCHEVGAVGPMAGVISSSMPVFVLNDEKWGTNTFSNISEGRGRVLRYGGLGDDVMERLNWMANELAPALQRALERSGPISMRKIMAEALHMGDDLHNRYKAASSLFTNRLSPYICATSGGETGARVLEFIAANDYTFLNPGMASQKAMADAAHGVEGASVVTTMARNGTDFGIRVSGLGDEWFTAPAPQVTALYFPQYTKEDANPDLGDSAIAETTGFGGFAAAASPSVALFVGGTTQDVIDRTIEMYELSITESAQYTIPALGFRGVPTGIDLVKVIETNVLPILHTGVAHKDAGVGQVGAGVVRAPQECFVKAFEAYAEKYIK